MKQNQKLWPTKSTMMGQEKRSKSLDVKLLKNVNMNFQSFQGTGQEQKEAPPSHKPLYPAYEWQSRFQ